jgi:hypothetical protein
MFFARTVLPYINISLKLGLEKTDIKRFYHYLFLELFHSTIIMINLKLTHSR